MDDFAQHNAEIVRLRKVLDEALDIIHDLLGLEPGSGEMALEFLYQNLPQSPAVGKSE